MVPGTPQNEAPPELTRPRDRLERRGARCLSDTELLSAILGNCASADAQKILDCVNGSIYQLSRWAIADFMGKGMTWSRACNLVAAFELARRFEDRRELPEQLSGAREVFEFFNRKALPLDQEKCWVISLDVRSRVLRFDEITTGTASASLFHPRDFLRPAIRCNASKMLLVHNHPSGDATPSPQDTAITRRLSQACGIFEIALVDHVIVGRSNIPPHTNGYFSFSAAGML